MNTPYLATHSRFGEKEKEEKEEGAAAPLKIFEYPLIQLAKFDVGVRQTCKMFSGFQPVINFILSS
jgi:hypothetical protein